MILEIYGDEIDQAASTEAKAALVAKLLKEAKGLKEPAGKFTLIRTALDHAPDAKTALRAVDEMAQSFEIDVVTAKAKAVWMVSKNAKSTAEQKDVAAAALQVAGEAERDGEFDVTLKLSDIAESAAQVEKRLDEIGPPDAGQPARGEAPAAGRPLSKRYVKTVLRHTIAGHDGMISTVATMVLPTAEGPTKVLATRVAGMRQEAILKASAAMGTWSQNPLNASSARDASSDVLRIPGLSEANIRSPSISVSC